MTATAARVVEVPHGEYVEVSLDDAFDVCGLVPGQIEEKVVQDWIASAVAMFEGRTGRLLRTHDVTEFFPKRSDQVALSRDNPQSFGMHYYGIDGQLTVWPEDQWLLDPTVSPAVATLDSDALAFAKGYANPIVCRYQWTPTIYDYKSQEFRQIILLAVKGLFLSSRGDDQRVLAAAGKRMLQRRIRRVY